MVVSTAVPVTAAGGAEAARSLSKQLWSGSAPAVSAAGHSGIGNLPRAALHPSGGNHGHARAKDAWLQDRCGTAWLRALVSVWGNRCASAGQRPLYGDILPADPHCSTKLTPRPFCCKSWARLGCSSPAGHLKLALVGQNGAFQPLQLSSKSPEHLQKQAATSSISCQAVAVVFLTKFSFF